MSPRWSAMILTGGRSSRFGSDKSQAILGETSLIEKILTTLPSDIEIVVVGPQLPTHSRKVKSTQENPLGGGPVAAIAAGLDLVESEYVAVVATDMPFAGEILKALAKNLPIEEDAAVPLDADGVRQTMCALYRVDSLRRAIRLLGKPDGQSMRALVHLLTVKEVRFEPSQQRRLLDIDTPSDLAQAIILNQELE